MIWSEAWYRAEREELGLMLTVSNPQRSMLSLHTHRPEGFEDYTVARNEHIPDCIMIIKPNAELDQEILRELGITPDLEE